MKIKIEDKYIKKTVRSTIYKKLGDWIVKHIQKLKKLQNPFYYRFIHPFYRSWGFWRRVYWMIHLQLHPRNLNENHMHYPFNEHRLKEIICWFRGHHWIGDYPECWKLPFICSKCEKFAEEKQEELLKNLKK